jgi:hypothetical protein
MQQGALVSDDMWHGRWDDGWATTKDGIAVAKRCTDYIAWTATNLCMGKRWDVDAGEWDSAVAKAFAAVKHASSRTRTSLSVLVCTLLFLRRASECQRRDRLPTAYPAKLAVTSLILATKVNECDEWTMLEWMQSVKHLDVFVTKDDVRATEKGFCAMLDFGFFVSEMEYERTFIEIYTDVMDDTGKADEVVPSTPRVRAKKAVRRRSFVCVGSSVEHANADPWSAPLVAARYGARGTAVFGRKRGAE